MQNVYIMTPDDYALALDAVGLEGPQRHRGAARLFGVDESTSRRWESGARSVDPAACNLLLLCIGLGLDWTQATRRIEKAILRGRLRSARRGAPRRAVRDTSGSARPERRFAAH